MPSHDLNHISQHVNTVPRLSLTQTNVTEVKNIFLSIKPNKATDCDFIPPRVLKQSADILCYPLSTLINNVLDTASIPQQWKLGEITPVFKKDYRLNKSNYRPLTILPSLSKVFGRLVHTRISPHFENIYHKYVFAYRKHHGCDTALLTLTEKWKRSYR